MNNNNSNEQQQELQQQLCIAPKGELVPRDVTVVSWLVGLLGVFLENGCKDFSDFWHEASTR